MFIFFLSYFIFSYTPVGYLLPENIKNRNKQKIEKAAIRVDELEKKINKQSHYIQNLQKVILGETSIDSIYEINKNFYDNNIEIDVDTSISQAEQLLDKNIKQSAVNKEADQRRYFDQLFLFDPVVGEISQKFRIPNHAGVDVVTKKDAPIKSCLSGVVLHSSYNSEDGHTIIISHENEIISVYKHAKTTNVEVGDRVKIGETIGIVGNTGDRTSGPHLHFELWSDIGPLDPLDYFSFGQ
ncbi:hypothetical protein CW751_09330 [Brumimicrobium salinarum]|uniref:M23ase beta-sheet core domain-containing protein n=2 Tax=Brumimicrobium salinarum TaxID=2058658 RepID=A0A2I0R264_9FLAO|nr:hypothetical protein CW751_09330 [Brumimicrobium salinarum]